MGERGITVRIGPPPMGERGIMVRIVLPAHGRKRRHNGENSVLLPEVAG